MQEALKNPHFKKIWEKVIMNKHPEAKSLEEALEMELLINGGYYKYFTSYLSYDYSPPDLEYKDYEGYTTNIRKCEKYNAYICEDIDAVYFLDEDFYEEHNLYYKEILSEDYKLLDNLVQSITLITLEDILSLLKNQISTMKSWDAVEDTLRKLNPNCCTATNKATKYTYNSYTQSYIRREYGRRVCENVLFVGLMIEIQRFWQLTKPLHEQTPETWEKIANLID